MRENYQSPEVQELFRRFINDEQREWTWHVIEAIHQRFPEADHYVTGGFDKNYIDLRIGVRSASAKKGKPFFLIWIRDSAICVLASDKYITDACWPHVAMRRVNSRDNPDFHELDEWLDGIMVGMEREGIQMSGSGLFPPGYAGVPATEETDMPADYLSSDMNETPFDSPLNLILYGPPGTGKTYNTINHALAILDPQLLADCPGEDVVTRRRLKDRYDELVKEDRVRFATFHQSFSYEDFVEGLRADSDGESGQIEYRVEPGVFKQLCDDARSSGAQVESGIRANPRIWKISINGTGPSSTKNYCLEHGEARVGWGETGDLRESSEQDSYYEALGSGDKGTLSYFAEQVTVGDILLCIQSADLIGAVGVVTGDYRYEEKVPFGVIGDYQHVRPVRWLYRDIDLSILPLNDNRQFTLKTVYAMKRFSWADLLAYLQQQGAQPVEPAVAPSAERKPYVLIIDEINRGNVSRIFGELITLIEPSKREGAAEALSLKLPYSKKPFSVPDNVYLLGTMNTADRSLAGLDIALRRRFTFHEMPPRPDLLDGVMVEDAIDVGQLLRVMNQRIEVLLNRDHCLGHAYFMPLKETPTLERLALIFRNQVLPLLQEYFFEDWQRIQWVLNDHRKADVDRFLYKQANNLQTLFGAEVNIGPSGQTWDVSEEAFERLEAYLGVIDHQQTSSMAAVKREAMHGELTLRELVSGTVEVWRAGVREVPSKPLLRTVAGVLGMSPLNAQGNALNTRALGRQLITRLLVEPA